jgi:hypothetical protein
VPTKKKHIGRNAKKGIRPQPESDEKTEPAKAMSEMEAQNAAGIQWVMFFIILWIGKMVELDDS